MSRRARPCSVSRSRNVYVRQLADEGGIVHQNCLCLSSHAHSVVSNKVHFISRHIMVIAQSNCSLFYMYVIKIIEQDSNYTLSTLIFYGNKS